MILDLPRRARPMRGGGLRLRYGRDFTADHVGWPLLLWASVLAVVSALGLDWRLSHALFGWEGYRWVLRDHVLTEILLHRGGHDLSIAAWLALHAAWAQAHRRAWPMRGALAAVLLSVLLSTLLVSWIKSWSNIDCPWDIDGLGGLRPHLTLWETFTGQRPTSLPRARCFPAGQASAGYAWVALYFFALRTHPAWRWHGLAAGLGTGAVLGFAQQLRGAHFLSHDLWTLALCWLVAAGVHAYSLRRHGQRV